MWAPGRDRRRKETAGVPLLDASAQQEVCEHLDFDLDALLGVSIHLSGVPMGRCPFICKTLHLYEILLSPVLWFFWPHRPSWGDTEVLRVVQSGRAPRATSATAPSLSWGGTFVGRVPPASWKFGFPRWGWLLFELCVTVPGSGEGVAFSHGAWLSSLQG